MLALLEDTGLKGRSAVDVVLGAGREWIRLAVNRPIESFRLAHLAALFVVIVAIACGIALAGTKVALLLCRIPTPPVTWIEDGRRVVLPPRIPSTLGLIGPLVQLLVVIRFVVGAFRTARVWKVGAREFSVWLVALFAGTALWQWFQMVDMRETGLPPKSLAEIRIFAAIRTQRRHTWAGRHLTGPLAWAEIERRR